MRLVQGDDLTACALPCIVTVRCECLEGWLHVGTCLFTSPAFLPDQL